LYMTLANGTRGRTMTKPLAQINLQTQAGQYKKSVGYHLGKDRSGHTARVERVWWLGPDEREAEQKAIVLLAQWRKIKARGGDVWTQADIDAVDAFLFPLVKAAPGGQVQRRRTVEPDEEYDVPFVKGIDGSLRAKFANPVEDLARSADQLGFHLIPKFRLGPSCLNLHAAIDLYVAHLEAKPNIAPSNLDRQRRDMADLKVVWADRPLNSIGFDEVTAIVNHFLSRPRSPQTRKPLAVATVITMLSHTRQFLTWLDDGGRWESPRKFEKIFRFKKRSILTPAEERRAQAGPSAFTIPELATLWANANERQRCVR